MKIKNWLYLIIFVCLTTFQTWSKTESGKQIESILKLEYTEQQQQISEKDLELLQKEFEPILIVYWILFIVIILGTPFVIYAIYKYLHNKKQKEIDLKNEKFHCPSCNRTSDSHPYLNFKYCSICQPGTYYCEDHMLLHKHKKLQDASDNKNTAN